MVGEKVAVRRMTLRQLLTHAEKCARDMIEHMHSTVVPRINDCRDLSRPVRRRSHYPTMVAVANSINKAQKMGEETQALSEYLHECLQDIRDRARKERVSRI